MCLLVTRFLLFPFLIFNLLSTGYCQSRCQNEPDRTQLPMPSSRVTYLMCLNGVDNVRNCPSGAEFDPFDRRCLQINGPARSVPPSRASANDQCAHKSDGTYLPDPTSRNRYIICEGGLSISTECPASQVFNSNTLTCERLMRSPVTRPAPPNVARPTQRPGFSGSLSPRPTRIMSQNFENIQHPVPFKNFK